MKTRIRTGISIPWEGKMTTKKIKILIGGGAGYVGSALIPELLEHGYHVSVIDLCWFGNYLPEEVSVIKKDLFHCDRHDFEGYDQFIFLAGLSNDPMAEESPSKNFIYNAALPAYLAFECKNVGVKRFIYASTCSVYGYTVDELYDEESPITCSYPYGISKLQGERGIFQMTNGISIIALRKGTISGHSPRMRFDLIVNTMFKTALKENKITINNPSIWRPILSMNDCKTAYLRAVQADYSISGIFNVASGNYTVGQVGDLVREELKSLTNLKIDLDIKNVPDLRNYKVVCDKAKTRLGFKPKDEVEDIIKELWINSDYYDDFNQNKYYNIEIFKKLHKEGKLK